MKYYTFLRLITFFIFLYAMYIRLEQTKIYNKSVNIFVLVTESFIITLHLFVCLEDVLGEEIYTEHLPLIGMVALSLAGILLT